MGGESIEGVRVVFLVETIKFAKEIRPIGQRQMGNAADGANGKRTGKGRCSKPGEKDIKVRREIETIILVNNRLLPLIAPILPINAVTNLSIFASAVKGILGVKLRAENLKGPAKTPHPVVPLHPSTSLRTGQVERDGHNNVVPLRGVLDGGEGFQQVGGFGHVVGADDVGS